MRRQINIFFVILSNEVHFTRVQRELEWCLIVAIDRRRSACRRGRCIAQCAAVHLTLASSASPASSRSHPGPPGSIRRVLPQPPHHPRNPSERSYYNICHESILCITYCSRLYDVKIDFTYNVKYSLII